MSVDNKVRPHPPLRQRPTHSVFKAGDTQVEHIEQRVEPRDGEGEPPVGHEILIDVFDNPKEADEKIPRTDRAQEVLHTISMMVLHVQKEPV